MPRPATRPIAAAEARAADALEDRVERRRRPSRSKTTSRAPSSRSPRPRSALRATAVTCAPARAASWTAKRPTPPLAPVTSTRLPSTKPAISSARSAVTPATGSVAACEKLTPSGSSARWSVRSAICCAHAPPRVMPTTRAPSAGPLPSAAARSTTPATSQPGTVPGSSCRAGGASRRGSARRRARRRAPREGSGCGSSTSVSATCGCVGVGGQGEHAAQRSRRGRVRRLRRLRLLERLDVAREVVDARPTARRSRPARAARSDWPESDLTVLSSASTRLASAGGVAAAGWRLARRSLDLAAEAVDAVRPICETRSSLARPLREPPPLTGVVV